MTFYVSIWAVFAAVTLGMAAYRQVVAHRDDESLHMVESDKLIAQQKIAYKKIGMIDRWGQSLTVLTIVYGLVLAAIYLHHVWQESYKIQFR